MTDDAKRRKYTTEFGLIVTVCALQIGRQQELMKTQLDEERPCHIYLVSKRPRLSVDPASVTILDGQISLTLRSQSGPRYEEFRLQDRHFFGEGTFEWRSEWPFEEFGVYASDGTRIAGGVVGLLFAYFRQWPAAAQRHRVVYVGQAFGKRGERTAWDRLKKHETVQRILGDCSPDEQVWLTLANISDLQLSVDIDPRGEAEVSNEADNEHARYVTSKVESDEIFWDKEAVALAEAGLIRYFQPEYNDRLKYKFPARKQVSLDTARDLDLHNLVVELQGDPVRSLYGSSTRPYSGLCFAGFEVHLDAERSVTLSLKATDNIE